jgi:hypothetical protein
MRSRSGLAEFYVGSPPKWLIEIWYGEDLTPECQRYCVRFSLPDRSSK